MPQFYFHLRTSEGLETDDEGVSLLDLDTAYLKACEAIPDLTAEFMSGGANPLTYSFVIANEAGETLMEVPFVERLCNSRRPVRPGQHNQTRRLSRELADAINAARETMRQSRAILARSRIP